jgi:flagellar protein FlaG
MTVFSKVPVVQQSPPRNSPEELRPESPSGQADQSKEAEKEVDLGVYSLNRTTNLFNRRIKFELSSDSDKLIVKIVDQKSGEVIRQFPPAEFVRLRERIKQVSGRMLKVKI